MSNKETNKKNALDEGDSSKPLETKTLDKPRVMYR